MAEFARQSIRFEGISFELAARRSLNFLTLPMLLIPDISGQPMSPVEYSGANYWEECFYMGVFPLILGVIAFFLPEESRKKTIYLSGIVILVSFLLALGKNFFLYKIMHDFLPFSSGMRGPIRYLLMAMPVLAYLVGLTIQYFSENIIERRRQLSIVLIIVLAAIMILGIYLVFNNRVERSGSIAFLITGYGGIALLLARVYKKIPSIPFQVTALSLLLFSAFSFGYGWNPVTDAAYFDRLSPLFTPLKDQVPPARVHFFPSYAKQSTVNFPSNYRISNITGYNPMVLTRYVRYLIFANFNQIIDDEIKNRLIASCNEFPSESLDIPMISLLGPTENFTVTEDAGPVPFKPQRVSHPYPRAFLVPNHRIVGENDILPLLRSGTIDPSQVLLLEEDPGIPAIPTTQHITGTVKYLHYEPDIFLLQVNTQQPCWLFLSEIWFPGWKAYVDGRERTIYRAD